MMQHDMKHYKNKEPPKIISIGIPIYHQSIIELTFHIDIITSI